jgi:serine/threonine-protein kinase
MMDTAGRVRLMDFGIAKGMGDAASTVTGQILGTPEYMSPEQIQAQPVDYRTDIYSLGVMTYELLTGRVPFRAATPLATIMLQVQEPPRLDDPAIPPALVPILGRALAKEPEDRYQSAREFVTALLGVAPSLESFAPASLSPTSEADISTMEMATPKFLIRPRNQERTASAQLASVGTGRSESPDRRRLWVGAVAATGLLATFVALRVAERGAAEPPAAQSTLETLPPPGAAAATGQARDEAGAAKPAPSQGHPPPSPRAERATVPAPSPPARAAVTAREEGAQRAGQARTGASPTSSRAATAPSIPRAAPSPSAAASTEARPAPPGATGRLQLGASPYAQVTVDGKDAGTLPLRPLELAPGPHVVRFAHPSYRPLERTVTIRAGETTKVFVNWSVDGIPR